MVTVATVEPSGHHSLHIRAESVHVTYHRRGQQIIEGQHNLEETFTTRVLASGGADQMTPTASGGHVDVDRILGHVVDALTPDLQYATLAPGDLGATFVQLRHGPVHAARPLHDLGPVTPRGGYVLVTRGYDCYSIGCPDTGLLLLGLGLSINNAGYKTRELVL